MLPAGQFLYSYGVPVPEISPIEHFKNLIGQEAGASDWMTITQQRINLFAEATGDLQWIHVDVERSNAESPFGGTIAHGFLTLSLLPLLLQQSIALPAGGISVNYGLNKVRFPAPLRADSRVRGVVMLHAIDEVTGGVQFVWEVTVEIEGSTKPACVAELLTRYYP